MHVGPGPGGGGVQLGPRVSEPTLHRAPRRASGRGWSDLSSPTCQSGLSHSPLGVRNQGQCGRWPFRLGTRTARLLSWLLHQLDSTRPLRTVQAASGLEEGHLQAGPLRREGSGPLPS